MSETLLLSNEVVIRVILKSSLLLKLYLMTAARGWCITLNLDADLYNVLETASQFAAEWCTAAQLEMPMGRSQSRVTYIIWQLERGAQQQRFHLQGYLECTKSVRMSTVKTWLNAPTAHLEARQATRIEARDYCQKMATREAGPWVLGVWGPGQGHRSDLAMIAHGISTGELTFANIRQECPAKYMQYRNGMRDLLADSARKRAREFRHVEVTILTGPAGCGKTSAAIAAGEDYFILDPGSNGSNVWFDGYEEQDILIIDDYYGWIKWTMLLRLLDGYQVRLPIKGGFTYASWTRVYITSNQHPAGWYNYNERINWEALTRRVTRFQYWDGVQEEPRMGRLPTACVMNDILLEAE